jgi:hypothetical protein
MDIKEARGLSICSPSPSSVSRRSLEAQEGQGDKELREIIHRAASLGDGLDRRICV